MTHSPRQRRIAILCFGPMMSLITLADPLGLMLVPILFLQKNGFSTSPEQLALFQAGLEIPAYFGFVFGWLRDRYIIRSRIGDGGGIVLLALLAATSYLTLSWVGEQSGLLTIFWMLLAIAMLVRFTVAITQATLIASGRLYDAESPLSAASEAGTVLGNSSALLIGGWLARTHTLDQSLATAIIPCLLLATWAWLFRRTLPAESPSVPGSTSTDSVPVHHDWMVFSLILFIWNFSPVSGTPLLYFLTDHKGFSASDFGEYRAVYYVTMALTPLLYTQVVGRVGRLPIVAAAVGLFFGMDAAADNHGEAVIDEALHEFGRAGGVVGVIAIDGDKDIGVDFTEHAAHDTAFALLRFGADDRSGGGGDLAGFILRVVVVDVDISGGERFPEITYNGGDSSLLVVAGDKNSNARRTWEWSQVYTHSIGIVLIG